MADAPFVYKKLPGRGGGIIGTSALWEGPDHLLLVKSWPGGEGYRRFFFADIQAIVIRPTARRLFVNLTLLVLALASVSPVLLLGNGSDETLYGAAIIGTVWIVFLLLNSLAGPTCETQIQTVVQTETIPSMSRIRRAEKVLALIQPRILAAQAAAETAQPLA